MAKGYIDHVDENDVIMRGLIEEGGIVGVSDFEIRDIKGLKNEKVRKYLSV